MKIWAHRGCSQRYPENTLTAFSKAAEIKNLTGIELDIQLTKDGEIVVIHDERVDRTTDGVGYVRDYTYSQLRALTIETGYEQKEKIPSIMEVLDLLQNQIQKGFFLNVELKNSYFVYTGMEEKILDLMVRRGLQENVIYSSFYTKSLCIIRKLNPKTSIGILDSRVSDCFYKKRGAFETNMDKVALHPFWKSIDITREQIQGQTVRAWFSGHLFPEKPTGIRLDLDLLEQRGITDVFLNEPEIYL